MGKTEEREEDTGMWTGCAKDRARRVADNAYDIEYRYVPTPRAHDRLLRSVNLVGEVSQTQKLHDSQCRLSAVRSHDALIVRCQLLVTVGAANIKVFLRSRRDENAVDAHVVPLHLARVLRHNSEKGVGATLQAARETEKQREREKKK